MYLNKIGIQFFAAEGTEGGNPPAGNEGGNPKTFTQEEVNSVAASEKAKARRAILKELGYEVPEGGNYQDQVKTIKDILDQGKSDQQKTQEAKEKAEGDLQAEMAKSKSLQAKIDAMSAGVKPEFVDDAIALLTAKVTQEKPLTKLLEEYKEKYPNWFGTSESKPKGTGGPTNPPRKGNEEAGLGKRLAQAGATPAKSSYFKK